MRNGAGRWPGVLWIGLGLIDLIGPIGLTTALWSGCMHATRSEPAIAEAAADEHSGADHRRGGARQLEIQSSPEAPLAKFVTDTQSVSWPAQQRTLWRRFDLENLGEPTLRCEVRAEPAGTRLEIDLTNALGTMIGHATGSAGSYQLTARIEDEGAHFLRIRAAGPGDAGRYSLRCAWTEAAPPPLAEPRPRPRPVPKPGPCCAFPDPWNERLRDAVAGEIVQSYRENDKTILFINRGSDSGVSVGTPGEILDGLSGTQIFSGGSFQVVRVIDGTHCVAESKVRSRGRNIRVLLFPKERPAEAVSPPAPAPTPGAGPAPTPN